MKYRDFEKNPVTVDEAVEMFKNEDADLAFASYRTVQLACDRMEEMGDTCASDIVTRWDNYQEELACLYDEALKEFM